MFFSGYRNVISDHVSGEMDAGRSTVFEHSSCDFVVVMVVVMAGVVE